jgi:hypothetical protein
MPYNYLVDPTIRNSLNIDLKSSIVILDEGHNVVYNFGGKIIKCKESVSNDASSFEITTKDLKGCLAELDKCIKYLNKSNYSGECSVENIDKLKGISRICWGCLWCIEVVSGLEKLITDTTLNSDGEFVKSGSYIYEVFSNVNIDQESASKVTEIVEQAIAVLTEQHITGSFYGF